MKKITSFTFILISIVSLGQGGSNWAYPVGPGMPDGMGGVSEAATVIQISGQLFWNNLSQCMTSSQMNTPNGEIVYDRNVSPGVLNLVTPAGSFPITKVFGYKDGPFIRFNPPVGVALIKDQSIYCTVNCSGVTYSTTPIVVGHANMNLEALQEACSDTIDLVFDFSEFCYLNFEPYTGPGQTPIFIEAKLNESPLDCNNLTATSINNKICTSGTFGTEIKLSSNVASGYNTPLVPSGTDVLEVKLISTNLHFSMGLGAISIEFQAGDSPMRYKLGNSLGGYLAYGQFGNGWTAPAVGDIIKITSTKESYSVHLNNVLVFTFSKQIHFNVSAGNLDTLGLGPISPGDTVSWSLNGLPAETYAATVNIGSGTFGADVVKHPAPIFSGYTENNSYICPSGDAGTYINVNITNGVDSTYQWFNSSGTNLAVTNDSLFVNQPGIYYFEGKNNNGCTVKDTFNLQLFDNSGYSISGIQTCSYENSGSLTATGGDAYMWLVNGNPTSATISNLANGTYSVQITDNESMCQDTISGTITTFVPSNSISGTSVACTSLLNGSVTASDGSSYIWYNNNNATTSTISNLVPGTYYVAITDAATTCVDTLDYTIQDYVAVNPAPIAHDDSLYLYSSIISGFSPVLLNDLPSTNVGHSILTNGVYGTGVIKSNGIEYTLSSEPKNGLTDLVTYTIYDVNCPELNSEGLLHIKYSIIPRFVSPWTLDGKNDVWDINIPPSDDIKVTILNRWGDVFFETTNYQNDWSGQSNTGLILGGNEATPGTYFFVVRFESRDETIKGALELVK